jgi:hypothetical protein
MGIAHRLANTDKFEADAKLRIKSFLLACDELKEETCDRGRFSKEVWLHICATMQAKCASAEHRKQ